jgi:hypothetical protein
MLEPRLGPAICGRRDRPYLIRATELGERLSAVCALRVMASMKPATSRIDF